MADDQARSLRSPPVVDPAAFRPDPHAGFARYRPVYRVIDLGEDLPVVTRHADVVALMTDPRTRQVELEPLALRGVTEGRLFEFYANSMLFSNPPKHAIRRRPVARAFALKVVQAWRPHIRRLVCELIDAVDNPLDFDFLETIAAPLPSRLIARIIGAPEEDAGGFAPLVYVMSRGLGAFRPGDLPSIERAAGELYHYLDELIEDRRRSPRDDFLSAYVRCADETGEMSAMEVLIQIVSIVLAGSDTTRFALTMLVALLLKHPEQWQRVCHDEAAIGGAVLEGLRFEPPVGALGRVLEEAIEIDGLYFPAGTALSLSILSAQRDEEVYAAAGSFDISRTDHPKWSISFGLGSHRCLGEALARAELEEPLFVISRRMPDLELRGNPPVAKGHGGLRGTTAMRTGQSNVSL